MNEVVGHETVHEWIWRWNVVFGLFCQEIQDFVLVFEVNVALLFDQFVRSFTIQWCHGNNGIRIDCMQGLYRSIVGFVMACHMEWQTTPVHLVPSWPRGTSPATLARLALPHWHHWRPHSEAAFEGDDRAPWQRQGRRVGGNRIRWSHPPSPIM